MRTLKEYTIFDSYDTYSDENRKGALENIMENRFQAEEDGLMTVTDNYGKEVRVTREEFEKTITEEDIDNEYIREIGKLARLTAEYEENYMDILPRKARNFLTLNLNSVTMLLTNNVKSGTDESSAFYVINCQPPDEYDRPSHKEPASTAVVPLL